MLLIRFSFILLLFTVCYANFSLNIFSNNSTINKFLKEKISFKNPFSSKKNETCKRPEYDYLLLSIFWPPFHGLNFSNKSAIPEYWTIHGLWPNMKNNKHPFFCCPELDFNKTQIKEITKNLEPYWINLMNNKTVESFWKHEWNKHGTCGRNNPKLSNIKSYFNQTLTLYHQFNVTNYLSKSNIRPTKYYWQSYDMKDFSAAIRKYYPNRVNFKCTYYGKIFEKVSVIDSIYICFDHKTLKPIDCPNNLIDNCGTKIYYPSVNNNLKNLDRVK